MRKQEVLEKLCELVFTVHERVFEGKAKVCMSHDCFCGHNKISTSPVVDDKIIEFIEEAVYEKINNQ